MRPLPTRPVTSLAIRYSDGRRSIAVPRGYGLDRCRHNVNVHYGWIPVYRPDGASMVWTRNVWRGSDVVRPYSLTGVMVY